MRGQDLCHLLAVCLPFFDRHLKGTYLRKSEKNEREPGRWGNKVGNTHTLKDKETQKECWPLTMSQGAC